MTHGVPEERCTESALLSFKFTGTAMVGSLTMALVSAFAPLPAQVAVLGALISILAGLVVRSLEQEEERDRRRNAVLQELKLPLTLAPDHDLFDRYAAFSRALGRLSRQEDPVLREFALLKLASIVGQVESLASGRVVFSATETWRSVYERLLLSPDIGEYRSVAWVKTREYWRDTPGRQSMEVNFEAACRGTLVERIIILRDHLWPRESLLPAGSIRPWIEEQHRRGLRVFLIRESELAKEPELLADFGVYGRRAVGIQELDEQARTVRFELLFDESSIELARDRWRRLSLFARSYRRMLDQLPADR